jgi:alpha-1,2-mannosyltransferase
MRSAYATIYRALRDADWFGANRARAYSRISCAMTLLVAIAWFGLSHGGLDVKGKPIGNDFISFWTASKFALAGKPGLPWDLAEHWAAQKALFGEMLDTYTFFFYPPPYLLICLPLALLPYFWSLFVWLAATAFVYWRVVRAFLPGLDPVVFLAFPAVFINVAYGQNGFLSAALVGTGFLILDEWPLLAGVCFGAMVFKPQLILLLPFALLFARRSATLTSAASVAAAFCCLSYFVFGAVAWTGFFRDSAIARLALENNLIANEHMQSVFAATRRLGGPLGVAYALQGLTALAALAALFALSRRAFRGPAEAAATVCACLLATPFLLVYDLTLLAIPLAFVFREGRRTGFLPWEKTALLAAFVLPGVSVPVAFAIGAPLGPLTIAVLFIMTIRRGLASEATEADHPLAVAKFRGSASHPLHNVLRSKAAPAARAVRRI